MKKRTYRIRMTNDQLLAFAGRLNDYHDRHVADGYTLTAASGFWRTKAQGVTARLVYRKRIAVSGFTAIAYTYRGI